MKALDIGGPLLIGGSIGDDGAALGNNVDSMITGESLAKDDALARVLSPTELAGLEMGMRSSGCSKLSFGFS